MKKLSAFLASLSLVLALSAPMALAGDAHSGSVRPSKGNFVVYQWLSFVLSLEQTIPLI